MDDDYWLHQIRQRFVSYQTYNIMTDAEHEFEMRQQDRNTKLTGILASITLESAGIRCYDGQCPKTVLLVLVFSTGAQNQENGFQLPGIDICQMIHIRPMKPVMGSSGHVLSGVVSRVI